MGVSLLRFGGWEMKIDPVEFDRMYKYRELINTTPLHDLNLSGLPKKEVGNGP
jgi:hypothetical protein